MATTDINIGAPITGLFTATLVDVAGNPPTDVIQVGDAFRIDCNWSITGGLASSIGGQWYVQAAFEALGGGAEFRSSEIAVVLDGRTGAGNPYTASLAFPGGADFPGGGPAKVQAGDRNAVYEVAVLLAYTDVAGNAGPMAASVNLERLTLYP
jgi:hypothetical protein